MSKINTKLKSVSSKLSGIQKEMGDLSKDYADLNTILQKKLREEVAYNGSFEGLEVFNALNSAVSKNLSSVKNAQYLMKRLRDLSVFDVSEIEEEVINGNITKLMK